MTDKKNLPTRIPTSPPPQCPATSSHGILILDEETGLRLPHLGAFSRHDFEINLAEDGSTGWGAFQPTALNF
jgi:hypothetical protein